ncbi:hypothetical protein Tco_0415290 [Tanacetum coccineum]
MKKENMSIEEMRREQLMIEQLLQDYNGLGIEIRKKKRILMEEKSLAVTRHIQSICDDDDEYSIQTQEYLKKFSSTITLVLPIEEHDNSLSMGDEHLDTIPSVENLVPIPSEFEGISDDTCDVSVGEDPSTFNALSDHSKILSDSNDDGTSSDDDDFEDIEYVSLEEVNDEKEFDLEDILQIQDSPSSFPIPVVDSDSFIEESDTSLSHLDNSLPEFETFCGHTEETRRGSTTTHANYSLPEYDSFLFEIEPDQEGLISIDNLNGPLLELPEFESFHFDLSFLCPPPEPLDVEICLYFEPDAPVIDNFNELNDDQRGREFLDNLLNNAFSGTNGEDAVEHIDYFLKNFDPIKLTNVNYERIRLAVFPISVAGNASEWFDDFKGSITTWVDLTEFVLKTLPAFSYWSDYGESNKGSKQFYVQKMVGLEIR